MSQYNWFNLGGPAELFFKPKDKKELVDILRYSKDKNLKINVIGAGSNTLIRDKGIKGLTIKLGKSFSQIKLLDNETIEVGASALDKKLANYAQENLISGFEFLSCIPSSFKALMHAYPLFLLISLSFEVPPITTKIFFFMSVTNYFYF